MIAYWQSKSMNIKDNCTYSYIAVLQIFECYVVILRNTYSNRCMVYTGLKQYTKLILMKSKELLGNLHVAQFMTVKIIRK